MGTSSARKAPVGKFWRPAKIAIARFASGKEASPPTAREVVARYLTALASESEGDKTFRSVLIATAASLGNFYRRWEQGGWDAALKSLRLAPGSAPDQTALLPALLDKLIGPGNNLAEAVARAALIDHLAPALSDDEKSPPSPPSLDLRAHNSFFKVSHFLGLALCRKLLSDLGESLEFHAPSLTLGTQRREELRSHILKSIAALEPAETGDPSFSSEQLAPVLDRILTRLGGRHER